MYYRGTHAALVCFSITDRVRAGARSGCLATTRIDLAAALPVQSTFEGAKRWLTELQRNGVNNAVVFLVGNKLDLSGSRQVSQEEARVFAKARGLDYVEVSAKEDIGVRGVFDAVGSRGSAGGKGSFSGGKSEDRRSLVHPRPTARRLPAAQSSILASQEQAFSAQLELLDIHEALASPVSPAEVRATLHYPSLPPFPLPADAMMTPVPSSPLLSLSWTALAPGSPCS